MLDQNIIRIAKDIKDIKIQGASKIEIASIKGIYNYILGSNKYGEEFIKELAENINHLIIQRINEPKLRTSMNYILVNAEKYSQKEDRDLLIKMVNEFGTNVVKNNQKVVNLASQMIVDDMTILTHCHSNLVEKAILKAHDNGVKFKVVCTETRPRYQGRITAKALSDYGVHTTQIVDSAVSTYIKKIDYFITGADVIYSNGDVVNKIGTHTISIIAKNFKTPHVVLTTTHCYETDELLNLKGTIEMRDDEEIWKKDERPKNLLLNNPSFDITPSGLVDKFITEVGIFSPDSFAIWVKNKRL